MAITINDCHFKGRAGKDSETRFTSSGKSITKFTIATGGGKNRETGKEYETEWTNCEVWDNETAKGIKKGAVVEVRGRKKTEKYTDKQGQNREFVKIVCNEVLADEKPLTPRPVSDFVTDNDVEVPF